jgi:hypothetical protein
MYGTGASQTEHKTGKKQIFTNILQDSRKFSQQTYKTHYITFHQQSLK